MDDFKYIDNSLHCEGIKLTDIIAKVPTPFYLYSTNTLIQHYRKFNDAFSEIKPLICFSLKTCNNVNLISELVKEGSGIDTVSGGEIFLALKSGVDPSKIVYAGIGKTDAEISFAIENNIGVINIESEEEYNNIVSIAKSMNKHVKAALRVTPDVVDAKTHDKTKTGYKGSKFGVDIDNAKAFFLKHQKNEHVDLCGIHIHIGSPIYSPDPYVLAIKRIINLVDELAQSNVKISILDVGGGFAADYTSNMSPGYEVYAQSIIPLLKPYVDKGVQIIFEPGRTISANAGILVTQVNYIKTGGDKQFAVVDTGMHHLIRPALYDASHFIWPVEVNDQSLINERIINDETMPELVKYDVVGPICESSDYLAKGRLLPKLKRGDYLAIYTAGAYGMVMSSQYNSLPRPAEVKVKDGKVILIRERETYDDLTIKYSQEELI